MKKQFTIVLALLLASSSLFVSCGEAETAET